MTVPHQTFLSPIALVASSEHATERLITAVRQHMLGKPGGRHGGCVVDLAAVPQTHKLLPAFLDLLLGVFGSDVVGQVGAGVRLLSARFPTADVLHLGFGCGRGGCGGRRGAATG